MSKPIPDTIEQKTQRIRHDAVFINCLRDEDAVLVIAAIHKKSCSQLCSLKVFCIDLGCRFLFVACSGHNVIKEIIRHYHTSKSSQSIFRFCPVLSPAQKAKVRDRIQKKIHSPIIIYSPPLADYTSKIMCNASSKRGFSIKYLKAS